MDLLLLAENVRRISKKNGKKPTNACIESGAGKDFISNIKKGQVPSVAKVQMLADYLGVTTSELLGEKIEPAILSDSELREIDTIYDALSPENRVKLVELARMYQEIQSKGEGKK